MIVNRRNASWSFALSLTVAVHAAGAAELSIEKADGGVRIFIDGELFAGYVAHSGHQPAVWPIIGPGGQAMTRAYPIGPAQPGESNDHPHHRSLWFNHGAVNGLDFWAEADEPRDGSPQIRQRSIVESKVGDAAVVATENDWQADGRRVCSDARRLAFGVDDAGRWIDFTVEILASDGPVTFGDTKEGAFGVRVPDVVAVDAGKGGRIVNSRGQTDEDAWGMPAEWVDYRGDVDGKPTGVTIFDMPDSFRHPSRWHVRTYGLFAANPFGQKDFPTYTGSRGGGPQGEVVLERGESLRLHYRVLFHDGTHTPKALDAYFQQLAKPRADVSAQ